MIVLDSSRMRRTFVSAAILCTFLPQALPSPFLPTLKQLQQLPLQFQQSLRNLLGHKGPVVTYKGRPTTLRPNRPTPSSQQHQQDLSLLLQHQSEEVEGGSRRPEEGEKNPWGGLPSLSGQLVGGQLEGGQLAGGQLEGGQLVGGLPSLSGQLVSVTTSSDAVLDNNVHGDNDADGLFREDVLLGRPLHDKKINTLRNRL